MNKKQETELLTHVEIMNHEMGQLRDWFKFYVVAQSSLSVAIFIKLFF